MAQRGLAHALVLEDDALSGPRLLQRVRAALPLTQKGNYVKLFATDHYDGWTVPSAVLWVLFCLLLGGFLLGWRLGRWLGFGSSHSYFYICL